MGVSLPFELIREIIQLSLPPVQYSTYRERYNTLLGCSLISRNWKSIAQEELGKHLLIETKETADLLHRELTRVDSRSEVKVVSIRVYRSAFGSTIKKFSEILNECKHPKEVWISGFSWEVLSNLSKNELEKLNQIKTLHLINLETSTSLQVIPLNDSCFTFIDHLTLYNADDLYYFLEILLISPIFPSLKSFTLIASESDLLLTTPNISADLAKQIIKLTVYDSYAAGGVQSELQKNLYKFTHLKSLVLRDASYLDTPPAPVASSSLTNVKFIRMHDDYLYEFAQLQKWITRNNSHQQLKSLQFPKLERYFQSSAEHETVKLVEFAEEERIDIKFCDDSEFVENDFDVDVEMGKDEINLELLSDLLMENLNCTAI